MSAFLHPTHGPLHLGRPMPSPLTRYAVAKTVRMTGFLRSIPDAPDEFDNTNGRTSWGMMLNDSEGDCTCATCGHMITAWTNGVVVPDSAVQTEYEAIGHYVPGNPTTDNGAMIVDALNYFRDTGVGGFQISAHAEVNRTQMRIQQAVWVFGAIDIGIELPISAQTQVGTLWDFPGDNPDPPGGWGGHSVPIVKYDQAGLWCVTWGSLQKMTWRWFMYYCDEAHAAISPNWTPPVDPGTLVADLQQVGT